MAGPPGCDVTGRSWSWLGRPVAGESPGESCWRPKTMHLRARELAAV